LEKRFVQQQQAGTGRQCAGQGDALLLAAGKLVGIGLGFVGQAHQFQHFGDAEGPVGGRQGTQAEGDVALHGKMGKQGVVLEYQAHPALFRSEAEWPGRLTSSPPMRISPADSFSKPAMRRRAVVLPQPEGPSRQPIWPGESLKQTSSSTDFAP
jgi:hypothetical protein